MPTDACSDVVFSAKDRSYSVSGATKHFDFRDDLIQPGGDRFHLLQAPQGVVVAKTKRSDPPPPLELPELEGLQGKVQNSGNELLFGFRRDKVGQVMQPFRFRSRTFKQCELPGHPSISKVGSLIHVGLQQANRKTGCDDGEIRA
jgi:hypothetical protein